MPELLAGLVLGLGAGFSPGPLQALVVVTSLERGFGAGCRVAIAPLITDAPVIVLSVAVLASAPAALLNGLAVAGGLAIFVVGLRSLLVTDEVRPAATDLWRGIIVNILSPHPWVFWVGVGAPLVVGAWRRYPPAAVGFLVAFYVLLVGTKVGLAWAVARGRRRLSAAARRRMITAGATLMMVGGIIVGLQGVFGRFG